MATSNEKIVTFHGKPWTKEQEDKLLELSESGENWVYIAETMGRTTGACKARLYTIQEGGSPFQGSPSSSPSVTSLSDTKVKSEKQLLWSPDDELLLLELRALDKSYNDIANLFSPPRDPRSVANHYLDIRNRGIDLLERIDKKKIKPFVTSNEDKKVATDYDHLEDMIKEMHWLTIRQTPKKPTVCCFHCLRPTSFTPTSRQPLCLQCKTVQTIFTADGLFEFLEMIKKTRATKKDRVPLGKEGLAYVWKQEYDNYLKLDLSDRSENGSKTARPRASCETLLKLATDNGLTDTYTNVEGHWTSKDDLWRLGFAYIVSETGGIKLKPVLAVIARLSECSTEEQIMDWVSAIRSN